MIDDDNFFNRSIHDAVRHDYDYWRNYQSCTRVTGRHKIGLWMRTKL